MKILCINTAFSACRLAIKMGQLQDFVCLDSNAKSSEKVLPAIDALLSKHNLELSDLDIIAVVVGPGSFTGVRIGVALVKGFCAVYQKIKVIEINSLDLMAQEFQKNATSDFCCVQNALGGRFFVRQYDKFANPKGPAILSHEIYDLVKVGLKEESLSDMDFFALAPSEVLLEYSCILAKRNEFVLPQNLAPVYLRLSQAEENLQKKEENAEN